MSDAPAPSPIAVAFDGRGPAGGLWLLQVKASKPGIVIWLLGMSLFVLPFMTAMSVAIIGMLVWALMTPQPNAPAAWPYVAAALLCMLGPAVAATLWLLVRGTIGLWVCLRRGRPAVRADDAGLEVFNTLAWRWDRLAWQDVGALAQPETHTFVVEHMNPDAWLAGLRWWKRFGKRQARQKMGVYPAIGFGLPMEEPTREVLLKIAALRDAKHAGLRVEAGEAVGSDEGY
jgi:hypothetical protein